MSFKSGYIHPILFVLAIVALVMFFSGRRGAAL
jgi:hypothetical protein